MPKAISVHVGLDHVDPAAYQGWDGTLSGCVNDAHDLAAMAAAEGYRTTVLTDRQATAAAVLESVRAVGATLAAGDIFLLSYSGHGGQLADADHDDDEPRGFDRTLACWDRQLLDDELHAVLAGFACGVRIVVVADTSLAGTAVRHPAAPSPPVRTPEGARRARMIPAAVAARDAGRRRGMYLRARRNSRAELRRTMAAMRTLTRRQAGMRRPTDCIAARIVLLAACQDNQVAYDGPDNGAFTAALLAVWNGGRYDGSYPEFLSAVRARLAAQTPDYVAAGRGDPAWEASRPFAVDITGDLELEGRPRPSQLRASR